MYIPSCRTSWITAVPGVTVDVWKDADLTSAPKGFVLLDVDEQTCRAQMQFVQMAARTLYTLEVNVSNVMTTREAAERMEEAVKQAQYPSGSLVKFVLTGEVEVDAEINCEYLQNLFSDYFYFEKVKDRTTLRVDYSDYEKDASLKGSLSVWYLDLNCHRSRRQK